MERGSLGKRVAQILSIKMSIKQVPHDEMIREALEREADSLAFTVLDRHVGEILSQKPRTEHPAEEGVRPLVARPIKTLHDLARLLVWKMILLTATKLGGNRANGLTYVVKRRVEPRRAINVFLTR